MKDGHDQDGVQMLMRLKSAIKYVPAAQWAVRSVRFMVGAIPEPDMKLVALFADPRLLVLDVGANAGSYPHAILRAKCRVVAFEANPKMVGILNRFYGR